MNRHDTQLLQSVRGYPALSVLMPTHRLPPQDRQNRIDVKKPVVQAINRLLAEFSEREIKQLLTQLMKLFAQLDYGRTLQGLALLRAARCVKNISAKPC